MRTAEELTDGLAEERIWRVKEITAVSTLAGRSNLSVLERDIYCRAGAMLFYAHWEGYIKRASTYYLKFLSFQRLQLDEMSEFMICLYMQQSTTGDNLSPARLLELSNNLMRTPTLRPKLAWKNRISTEGNLSSPVLRRICSRLGLDYNVLFAFSEVEIDSLLLKNRNAIAHGDKGQMDLSVLGRTSTLAIALITTFRDAIENSVTLRAFRRL